MRKTNFTFRQKGRSKVKANSKLQFSLWFLLFALFMGMSSAIHAQCTLTCVSDVQISLGQNGIDTIDVDQALKDTSGICTGLYVKVVDSNGDTIPNNIVDCSYVGETVSIGVFDAGGNNCWTDAMIEDKKPPIVTCVNDTISCLESGDPPNPIADDNCTPADQITFETLSEEPFSITCDSNFIGGMVREIRAVDASGNESAICEDTLFIERFDIDEVDMPDSLMRPDNPLLCNESNWTDTNGDGYPDPGEPGVGVPMYEGTPVFPNPPSMCNVYFEYNDVEFPVANCVRKIMRTYTAYEWWCQQEITQTYVQVIEIVDTTGPDVTAPDDFVVTSDQSSCTATTVIPPATVTEDCGEITQYIVDYPGGVQSLAAPGPVSAELPAGENTIYISAYNECFLEGVDSLTVTVNDNTPPIANCDQNTTTSLGIDGTSRVYAETFDDGSYDNCDLESMDVKRMDGQCGTGIFDDFGPYVEFCCADLGSEVTILFRVTDANGNSNTCMVNVEVQDKLPPTLQCPDDVTVSCTYPLDTSDLSEFGDIQILSDPNDVNNLNEIVVDVDPGDGEPEEVVGEWGYAYDNCDLSIDREHSLTLGDCGSGTLERTFIVRDVTGAEIDRCTQTITITDFDPFGDDDIDFPDDVTITTECDVSELTPQDLINMGHEGRPDYTVGPCDLLADTFDQMVFDFDGSPNSNACFKIMRTWKVLDWCNMDSDGRPTVYTGNQYIKVMNNVAPEFTQPCEDITLTSQNPDCNSRFVELTQSATDDCLDSTELSYSYKIDEDNDGIFDLSGNTNDASGDYGIGTHRIQWTVSDNCGNVTACEYTFTVESAKAGTPIAHNGLSIELMPVDNDGDGTIDGGMVDITPDLIDAGSFHSCGFDFTLSFSPDPTETVLMFDCDDVGAQEIELWLHASNGTSAHVRTTVYIQANDPSEPCGAGNTGPSSLVGGTISTTADQRLPHVPVNLDGEKEMTVETDMQGEYSFGKVEQNKDYDVSPKMDDDILNGVTTWDLTLIQQHILGMNEIVDPYLLIAADINNDNRITVLDLVDLRKTILGLNNEFPDNKSWRFVDKEYAFDGTGAEILEEDFPELYQISDLSNDMRNVNFYGMKVGDINNTVTLPGLQGSDGRDADKVTATIENVDFSAGDLVEVPVKAADLQKLLALQYTMNYNSSVVDFVNVKSGVLEINDENFAQVVDGQVTMSWNDVNSKEVNSDETLFTLVFSAGQTGTLADVVEFNDETTEALAVDNNEEKSFEVTYRGTSTSEYALYQNVPNPVDGNTVIRVKLAEEVDGKMTFYDVTGKVLKTVEKRFQEGYNEVSLESSDLSASGVVFYNFSSDEFSATKKMIILN